MRHSWCCTQAVVCLCLLITTHSLWPLSYMLMLLTNSRVSITGDSRLSINSPAHRVSSNRQTDQHPHTPEGIRYWSNIIGKQISPGIFDNCELLFANTSRDALLPGEFQKSYKSYMERVRPYMRGGKRGEGSALVFLHESVVLWNIAHLIPSVQTICETGFNTGESSFLWLSAKQNIHVYSFDLGRHSYARPLAEYLQGMFPGRLTLVWGDSTMSVPVFAQHNPQITCDLMFVDGGHSYTTALADFNNLAKMSHTGSIVVLDNYPDYALDFMKDLGSVWETQRREGRLVEIFKCSYGRIKKHGFAVGVLYN